MTNFRRVLLALVCLGITVPGVSWAEPAHDDWVDDPYAPHVTRGTTARVGTAVGFLYGENFDVSALGLTTALGQRFGRLAIEAEFAYLSLNPRGPSSAHIGDAEQLGVVGRFDVLRIGPEWVGGNSLLSLYIEGGAAVAWTHFDSGRMKLPDSKRAEGQAGFGIALDHRLQEPIGFPHRIGWFLGWRQAFALHGSEAVPACRGSSSGGASCNALVQAPDGVDHSMLFQSSLVATW